MTRRDLLMQSENAGGTVVVIDNVTRVNKLIQDTDNWIVGKHWSYTKYKLEDYASRCCYKTNIELEPGTYKFIKEDTNTTKIAKYLYRRYDPNTLKPIKILASNDVNVTSLDLTLEEGEALCIVLYNDSSTAQALFNQMLNGSVKFRFEKVS